MTITKNLLLADLETVSFFVFPIYASPLLLGLLPLCVTLSVSPDEILYLMEKNPCISRDMKSRSCSCSYRCGVL